MKRQFVRISSTQDHRYSEQSPSTGQWSPILQRDVAPAREEPEFSVPPRPRTGLLSGWRVNEGDHSLSDLDTQPAQIVATPVVTEGLTTDPAFKQASAQGFVPGQTSHYQPGITSSKPPLVGRSIQESPSLQPFPGSRLAFPDAQPFPKPPIWPSTSIGYQSGPPPTMQRRAFQAAPPPLVQPPAHKGPNPSKRKKSRFPIWARVAISVFLVLLILTGVSLGYYQVNFASHISNITGQKAAPILKGQDGDASQANTTIGSGLGNQRINILLLGSDNDEKFFAPLAQTDIVITIDPTTNYVGMLSIPRDLWINVPGFGAHKLDEAFAYGWQYVHQAPTSFPNAAGLSIATIEQDFGIPINHYAWVGLDGFIKVINTAGGVDIDAIHPMTDDIYPNDINTKDVYGYKRLYIAPGPQHMDGLHALEYVRTRHSDLVGDFGRSQRQQQVLSQLKTKLATPGIVSELPELTKDLDGYVRTDMDLPGIINLMGFARTIDPNTVDRLVLSPPYSTAFTTSTGAYALRPNCNLILPKIVKMFALGDKGRCEVAANGNTLSSVASSAPTSPTAGHMLSQMAEVSTASLQQGRADLFGLRSLLELVLLVTFESIDAVEEI